MEETSFSDPGGVKSENGKPKHMRILTSFFASVFLAAASAQAQDGPSYEETVKFIQNKVSNHNYDQNQKLNFPDRCIVVKTVSATSYSQTEGWVTVESKVDLSTLDPSRVTLVDGGVAATARENRKVVTHEYIKRFNNHSDFDRNKVPSENCARSRLTCSRLNKGPYISVYVIDPVQDNRPRMARALSHLIKLCGGTEELF